MQQKPAYTASIVQIKSNETIPAALLAKLLSENSSAFGMVVKEADKLFVEKFPRLENVEKTTAFLAKIENNSKKYPRMYSFMAYPTDYDEDEVMPWTVLKDSKGQPILVVAIEGDFPQYVNDEFSEPFNLLQQWLGDKIEGMYKTLGNNVAKTVEYLKTAQFQSDFKNVYGHRACLAIMPSHGDQFVIEDNNLGLPNPTWGTVSNAYGYTEAAIEAATLVKAETPPEPRKSRYADDEPAKVTPPQVDPTPVKTVEEKVAADIVTEEDWSPPKGLQGKPLKAAYRALPIVGATKEGLPTVDKDGKPCTWRDHPTVRIKITKKPEAAKKADTAVKVPNNKAELEAKVLTMPIISGPVQAKAVDHIKKHLADGSVVIDDPVRAQEAEQKLPVFSELVLKTGKLAEIEGWRTEYIFQFAKDNPETAALAIIELRRAWMRMKESIAAGDKTLGELTGTKTAPATSAPAASSATSASTTSEPTVKKSRFA